MGEDKESETLIIHLSPEILAFICTLQRHKNIYN